MSCRVWGRQADGRIAIGARVAWFITAAVMVSGCKAPEQFGSARPVRSMAELQTRAQRFHSVISEPHFERTPAEITQATTNALERYRAQIEAVGSRDIAAVDFTNTIAMLDQAEWEFTRERYRLFLLQETATNAAIRSAAARSAGQFSRTVIDGYRQDIYARVKAIGEKDKSLKGEDARLLRTYLQRGKSAGLDLGAEQQERLKGEWKQLAAAELQFLTNVSMSSPRVKMTQAELKGLNSKFLQQYRTGPGEYLVPADIYLRNLRLEQTRKRLCQASAGVGLERNRAPVQRILELRGEIAQQLGYGSWAEYVLRGRLAGSPSNALAFCREVSNRARPSFDSKLAEMTRLKVRDTGDPNARIELWDLAYYHAILQKHRPGPSMSRVAISFPATHVMDSMFDVCERVFGIKIEPVRSADSWADDVRLYAVSDGVNGEPLGLVYFDLFERPGKRDDSFTETLVAGKLLPDGGRQCPVATVEMSFARPPKGKSTLLWPGSVRSLYHEFGHALHEVLSRAKYANLAGNDVSRDYVEVPSELLGQFLLDRGVIDIMTRRNGWPFRKMYPREFEQMKRLEAEQDRSNYRWSMAWALTDLALHTEVKPGFDAVAISNRVLGENYLPFPSEAAPITSYRSLVGYAAAVYSHVWCEAIATDLLGEFAKAPGGLLDPDVGKRLRREIFESGDARPPRVSLEKFLGRPYSMEAFFKKF